MAKAVRSKARNKQSAQTRRLVLWSGALAIGLAAVFSTGILLQQYLSAPGRLPLRVIQVTGEFKHLSRPEIEQVVVAAVDGGFFTVDMHRVRDAALQMPWVDEVSVRRIWPDTLHMLVTEQVPLARWGNKALVNHSGGVFKPRSLDMAKGLVQLSGPKGSTQRVVDFYLRLLPLAKAKQLQIAKVLLDQRRHWTVAFDNDLKLVLGRESVERRLVDFLKVYPQLRDMPGGRPERVDMRYAHGFAVKWKKAPAGAVDENGQGPRGDA